MKKVKLNRNVSGVFYTRKQILKFESNNYYINDDDIQDLFLGLIRLVEKNTEMKVENRYISTINKLKLELEKYKNINKSKESY